MKVSLILLTSFLFFVFQSPKAQAKDEDKTHHFKITGNTHVQMPDGEKVVEYDPASPDHLFITDFNKTGRMTAKGQYLFTGKKFDLSVNYVNYLNKKEIMMDGFLTFYNKEGQIEQTTEYDKGKIISRIFYYPNGQQQLMVPGENMLNGEYKMWHPNGQISFSGNFKDNLKEGNFELFDESGKLLKKGEYQNGKLLSGEPVLMDITYDNPEVTAIYEQGEDEFNKYLSSKAAALGQSKIVYSDKQFDLKINFNETGKMTNIINRTNCDNAEKTSVELILKACPPFKPATVENIAVKSCQEFTFQVSANGVKLWSADKIYTSVDKYPEFGGGPIALRNYLSSHLKYPEQARQLRVQGKVFVAFVVNKDGQVSDAKIQKGVHPLLDTEALRVVSNMPKWKPGMMQEKPVRVSFTLPINFNLTVPVNSN